MIAMHTKSDPTATPRKVDGELIALAESGGLMTYVDAVTDICDGMAPEILLYNKPGRSPPVPKARTGAQHAGP